LRCCETFHLNSNMKKQRVKRSESLSKPGRDLKRPASTSSIYPMNWREGIHEIKRLQRHQGCEESVRTIELHIGVGWKAAFGIHLEDRNEERQKSWRKKMTDTFYIHPKTRPGKNPILQRLWIWIAPFIVWDDKGPQGFILRNRALDFYYQCSRNLKNHSTANISRKGWFRSSDDF